MRVRFLRLVAPGCVFAHIALAQQSVPDARVTPHLRFGGEAQLAAPLSRIRALAILPNRTIVVLDDRNGTLSLFDSTGRFLKEIARRGQGPGELSDVTTAVMGRFGNTLWIHHAGFPQAKVLLFGLDGSFLSSHADVDTRTSGRGTTGLRGLRTPAALLEQGQSIRPFLAGALTDSNPVLGLARFSASMSALDTVLSYRASQAFVRRGRGWMENLPNIAADYPLMAVQPGGTHVLVLDRSAAKSALEVIRVAVMTNRQESTARYPIPAQPLSQAFVDSSIGALAKLHYELMGPSQQFVGPLPEFTASIKQGTVVPRNAPLARALIAGMDGTAWVRLWSSTSTWVVFDSAGRPLQRVVLPNGAELLAAERDYVWCVTKDATDVPRITTFRITR